MKLLILGSLKEGGVSQHVASILSSGIKPFIFDLDSTAVYKTLGLHRKYIKAIKIFESYFFLPISLLNLHKGVKKFDIKIIHAHVLRFGFLAAIYKVFNPKIKIVYTPHGCRYFEKKSNFLRWLFKQFEIFVFNASSTIIFIRKYEYTKLVKEKVLKPDDIKAKLIYPAFRKDYLIQKKINEGPIKVIGMLGSVYNIKQPLLFCRSAEILLKENQNLNFIWGGDGPDLNMVNNYIREKDLNDKIIFTGSLSGDQLIRFWEQVDCLMLTSKSEIFPTVIIEAFISKTLVITTNFDGHDELVEDGYNGLVVNGDNFETEITNCLNQLKNEELRKSLVHNAYNFYKKNLSNVKYFHEKHKNIYKEILDDH
tara:strand:- start:29 stop:1129 length:1101 start_codon:yes stop_codon:yes gene_type:complete